MVNTNNQGKQMRLLIGIQANKDRFGFQLNFWLGKFIGQAALKSDQAVLTFLLIPFGFASK